jgi:pilus assembly protein CpaB
VVRWAPATSRRAALQWWVGRHRRALAAAFTALAVWAGLSAAHAHQPATVTVLVAVRDLAPGTVLAGADLRGVALPLDAVPPSALRLGASLAGRTLSVAVPAGVPVTNASLDLGAVLPPGTEATPVQLADPAESALVAAGDRVDVLAAPAQDETALSSPASGTTAGIPGSAPDGGALVVAADVVVLDVPVPESTTGDGGGLVVVAATPGEAAQLARAAVSERLSLTVRAW